MDFVAVVPKKVTRGMSSIKILVGGGISGGNDVINGVERHIHGWNLLAFDVFIITYVIRVVNKFEC